MALRSAAVLVTLGVLTMAAWHHRGALAIDRLLLHGYRVDEHSLQFRVARIVTEIGSPVAVVLGAFVIAGVVWRRSGNVVRAVACIAAPAAAGVAETLAKSAVGRLRPATAHFTGESGNGFPSGHAAGFAALAMIIALACGRRRPVGLLVLAGAASVLMAATRVLVGAHYPSDVIAGCLLGASIADIVWSAVGSIPAGAVEALRRRTTRSA